SIQLSYGRRGRIHSAEARRGAIGIPATGCRSADAESGQFGGTGNGAGRASVRRAMTTNPPALRRPPPDLEKTPMKRALLAATAFAVAALAFPAAQAADTAAGADGASKSRTGFFERIDADKDNAVTRQEMAAAHAYRFAKIDT